MGLRNRSFYHDYNIFFITTTCYRWLHLISIGDNFEIVQSSLKFCCHKLEASVIAYVIMPNHLHMILHFTKGKNRINFMRDFKKFTSVQIRKEVERINPALLKEITYPKGKQKFKIWQVCIIDEIIQKGCLSMGKLFSGRLKVCEANYQRGNN